jgi:tetratricopeptide (TPR) repeat protein
MGDRSVDAHDISRSVIVTGDGNNVALTLGDTGVKLPLRRKQFPPPERRRRPREGEPPRDLDLLHPEAGKLPLIGRNDLVAELQAWLDDDTDLSVYALIGRAGTGKTRLALEFCQAIDSDPSGEGEWIAGFLSPGDLGAVVETLTTHSFAWDRQTLLVIDYAAQCHQALARWLDRLADQKLDTKLRVLLLDREAPEAFGWWHELTASGPPGRRDLFHALRPKQLPDLSDLEERRALTIAALQAARELRPGAFGEQPIPPTDEDPDFDRRLARPQFGNPLNLVMAGLIALDRGPQGALARRRLDAARQIARRELRRLTELARTRQIADDQMRHVVAFNGLAGGLPIADLRKTVADELAISRRPTDLLGEVVELLELEFPVRSEGAQESRLSTIQPDLIGEAAIVEAFTGSASRETEALEVMRRAYILTRETAAQALIRIAQDFAYSIEDPTATDAEKWTGHRVMGLLLALAEGIGDPEQLAPLVFTLPPQTTVLREPAAELTRRLAAHFVDKVQTGDDPSAPIYASVLLNNLANRLSALGRREEALKAAEEAVRLYRALAEASPDIFLPDLAMSLNNLANRLSDLGRREEALKAAEEAVRLYRALAEARIDAFIPNLAGSLNNLANRLSDLGRREEALAAAEEAVRLRRALADARPDAFIPDLALSLNNLANALSALGRCEEALKAAEEAVRLRRALAEARPDAFIPDLALSLNNLANALSALGRREDALAVAEEAVRLRRALAEARPDAIIPNLALSLNNLANRLSDLGRREDALAAAEEAVRLYRVLAGARPDAFLPDLAGSLNNLANMLSDLGRREEALNAAEEAARLRRVLAEARPDAFLPDLAASLNNLANRLSDLGRREEALKAAEEAVRLYRVLAEARPDAFTPNLARSLSVLGNLYGETEKPDLALANLAEAIQLLTPTFLKVPEAVAGMMAWILQSYLAKCEVTETEPDEELLGPVIAVFESLTPKEEKE